MKVHAFFMYSPFFFSGVFFNAVEMLGIGKFCDLGSLGSSYMMVLDFFFENLVDPISIKELLLLSLDEII